MARLVVLAVLLASRATHAACFRDDSGNPDPGAAGVCVLEYSIPLGCPIHVLAPHASEPRPVVTRNTNPIALTSRTTLVATADVSFVSKDLGSCSCDDLVRASSFDRLELTIADLQFGDDVSFPEPPTAGASGAVIVAAGPCAEAVWPVSVRIPTACDLCPTPPVSEPAHDASCSTARGPAGALSIGFVVLALGFVARRRRSRTVSWR